MAITSPRKVLQLALAKITHGWTKGAYTRPRGSRPPQYCTLGALHVAGARASGPVRLAAFRAFSGVVKHANLAVWNDCPGRTKAEVIEAFEHAITVAPTSRGLRASLQGDVTKLPPVLTTTHSF